MSTPLVTRSAKGAPLTNAEMDGNLAYFTEKLAQTVDPTYVQETVASMSPKMLTDLAGQLPATQIILPDGRTLAQAVASIELALVNQGTSGAQNTAQPGAPTVNGGGSAIVGATLTGPNGTWSGAVSYLYKWFQQHPTTGVRTEILNAVANQYQARTSDDGFKLIHAVAGVPSAGPPSAYVFASAASATITANKPTNTVQPTLSHSGTQNPGTVVSISNLGTWTNNAGAVLTYEFLIGGTVVQSGSTNGYTVLNGDRGKTLTGRLKETTAQGTGQADTSNSVTVAGSTGINNLTAPSFSISTVTIGVPNPIVSGTWSEIHSLIETYIYIDGAADPYVTIGSMPGGPVYTPEQNDENWLVTKSKITNPPGITSLQGHTVQIAQLIDFNGQRILSPRSVAKTVAAPSATFTTTLLQTTTIQLQTGSQITPFKPVGAANGTLPYKYVATGLPNGLTMDQNTGFISGAPQVTFNAAQISVTVSDSASTPASQTKSFGLEIVAPSVTPLASAFAAGPGWAVEAPNDGDDGNNDYDAKPQTNGAAVAASLTSALSTYFEGVLTFGPSTVNGLSVLRHEVRPNHPLRNDGRRSETSYDDMKIKHGIDYWMSFAIKLDPDWTAANSGGSGDQQSFMQVHQQNEETTLTNGGPFGLIWRGIAGSELRVFTNGAGDNPTNRFIAACPAGKWIRFIIHYRSGVTSQQAPNLEIWMAVGSGAYTKLTDLAPGTLFGDPAQNTTFDWAKTGIYKWTVDTWGSTSKRGCWDSGLYFGQGVNLYQNAAKAVERFARDD